MTTSIMTIGLTGTAAARSALEVTAHNIANVDTQGYVRRGTSQQEIASPGTVYSLSLGQYNGVRVDGITRGDEPLLAAQLRRSSSSLGQADAEISSLIRTEAAMEQSGLFGALVDFEAALAQLESDPLNPSLRANALEQGQSVAETFQIAGNALSENGDYTRLEAQTSVDSINLYSAELAATNLALSRADPGSGSHAVLLDQRDLLLNQLSQNIGISTEFGFNGSVNVRLGSDTGEVLVNDAAAATLNSTALADGTLAFDLDGTSITPASGKLAGLSSGLAGIAATIADLDAIAASTIAVLNNAQASGAAADGTGGQPFFSGNDASDIAIALADGSGIATAPAGAGAGSLDTTNLANLRAALANGGPTSQTDSFLLDIANNVRSRSVTRDALATIAQSAEASYSAAREVDLDQEAANLIRYQQAFQASGRVIQVAGELFETILGIR